MATGLRAGPRAEEGQGALEAVTAAVTAAAIAVKEVGPEMAELQEAAHSIRAQHRHRHKVVLQAVTKMGM